MKSAYTHIENVQKKVMSYHHFDRLQKEFVDDSNRDMIKPLDCVPELRPKGSWTKGVKAWEKIDGEDVVIGWLHPPRRRNKKIVHSNRKRKSTTLSVRPNKGEKKIVVNPKREWRKAWADKVNRANMMDMRRQADKSVDVDALFSEDDEIKTDEN